MHFALRLATLCNLVLLVSAISGCGVRAYAGTTHVAGVVSGKAIERLIDQQLVPILQQQSSAMTIGASSCPSVLHLEGPRAGRCSLDVSGTVLPISVSRSADGSLSIRPAAAMLAVPDLESKAATRLAVDYGAQAHVRCGGASVRVVAPGAVLRCALIGSARLGDRLSIRVDDVKGNVTLTPANAVPGDPSLAPYFAAARGDRAAVPGPSLAATVRAKLVAFSGSMLPAGFFGAGTCPQPSILSHERPMMCTVHTRAGDLHVAVVRSTAGVDEKPVEQIVDTRHVGELASSLYRRRLAAAGLPGTAAVDCGAPRIVVLAPSLTLSCTLTATGAAPRVLLVRPGDGTTLKFDVPPRSRV